MNENAKCYYESALKLFMPIELETDLNGFIITLGRKRYFFYDFVTPLNNATSVQISRNKYFTNKILEKAGLPVPKSIYIHVSDFENNRLEENMCHLSFPVVAKPMIDGRFGGDVLCNIQNTQQLKDYLAKNFIKNDFILIEEFHAHLNSYRVLIFNNRILGVILRQPASVLGDGLHTIEELVDLTNIQRANTHDTLKPIMIDDECQIRLNELGINQSYIPLQGETVTLCYTCNASRGGNYMSLDKKICKENRQLLIKAARTLNLKLVGFDVLCSDINVPIEASNGVIIESNDGPSVRIHEQALTGKSEQVTRKMIFSFICRHPFSYLNALYQNDGSKIFIRSFILLVFIGILYTFS